MTKTSNIDINTIYDDLSDYMLEDKPLKHMQSLIVLLSQSYDISELVNKYMTDEQFHSTISDKNELLITRRDLINMQSPLINKYANDDELIPLYDIVKFINHAFTTFDGSELQSNIIAALINAGYVVICKHDYLVVDIAANTVKQLTNINELITENCNVTIECNTNYLLATQHKEELTIRGLSRNKDISLSDITTTVIKNVKLGYRLKSLLRQQPVNYCVYKQYAFEMSQGIVYGHDENREEFIKWLSL